MKPLPSFLFVFFILSYLSTLKNMCLALLLMLLVEMEGLTHAEGFNGYYK